MKLYRYNQYNYGYGSDIQLDEYEVVKETPKGYWIGKVYSFLNRVDKERWVSKYTRKRYAWPTQEDALTSFIARKKRQIEILKAQLKTAKEGLEMGQELAGMEKKPNRINSIHRESLDIFKEGYGR